MDLRIIPEHQKIQNTSLIRENKNVFVGQWVDNKVERIYNLSDKGTPLLAIPVEKITMIIQVQILVAKRIMKIQIQFQIPVEKRTTRIIQTQSYKLKLYTTHPFPLAHLRY